MKLSSLLLCMLFSTICLSQTPLQNATTDLTEVKKNFNDKQAQYVEESNKLKTMSESLDPGVPAQFNKTKTLKDELDKLYQGYLSIKNYYLLKGVPEADLDKIFKPKDYTPPGSSSSPEDDKKVYVLFGDKEIAEEDIFKKDPKVKAVFDKVIGETSEASLGTFEIPCEKQKIQLYDASFERIDNQFVLFKEVRFSIRDGNIYDIRLTVVDAANKIEYNYENKVPISMLNYMREAKRNFLAFRRNAALTNELIGDDQLRKHLVRISDVLGYLPNPGNNHVPDDIEYTFPTGKEESTSVCERRIYKVIQDTNLKNVLELRTYTDFLGLFGETPNGLIQVEGKADFYVVPFQIGRRAPMNILKKISPYVHFSRLDEDKRSLTIIEDDPPSGRLRVKQPLEIIEKSYLDMGSIIDVFGISFLKESPFKLNLYYAMRFQISTIERQDDDDVQFKTFGNGYGIRAEFKRFNNFGFIYSPEMTYYNHVSRIDFLHEPKNFWVFRNDAEVFYYPGSNKSQSIFLRLRSYLNTSDGEDSFFQLQFGYRFSIGLGDVKAKP